LKLLATPSGRHLFYNGVLYKLKEKVFSAQEEGKKNVSNEQSAKLKVTSFSKL